MVRLLVWYVIITAIFRCPSTETQLTDDSPRICKPYLSARTQIQPYVTPYYDTYAAPYVDSARPYADKLNKQFISPASRFSKRSYDLYAAPRVEQAKAYGLSQWNAIAVPQLQVAQARANQVYNAYLGPYVQQASAVVEPHYGAAKENAAYVHQKHVVPAVEYSRPLLEKAIWATREFALGTALPFSQSAYSSIVLFVDGTLVPTLRSLYRENVEPQLVMIGERLARYREGRKLQAVMDETTTSSVLSEGMSTSAEAASQSTAQPSSISASQEASPSGTPLSEQEKIAEARKQVESDLKTWQEKFSVAAKKGSEDLAQRVQGIMTGLSETEVDGVAVGLAKALKISAEKEIADAKSKINAIVESIDEDADSATVESAEAETLKAIRAAGASVKSYAQKLREWYNSFDAMLSGRASEASKSTLQVLDGIRDLGLQEIGMRWAWLDGVTYQDWQKYHDLKQQFADWRGEVTDVALKHPALEKARASANEVVADGMDTAEKAAAELTRLKDVGKWKVHARDASDNFESRAIPAAAVRAGKNVAESLKDVSESIAGTTQGTAESIVSGATEAAADASSTVSSALTPEESENVLSSASGVASSATSSAGEAAIHATNVASDNIDAASEAISSAGSSAGDYISQATEAVSDTAESAISSASSVVDGTTATDEVTSSASSIADDVASSAEDFADDVTSTASSASAIASSRIIPGAMAQKVKGSKPILDDVFDDSSSETFSDKVKSMVEDAGDRYAEVTKAVSEALLGATSTQGSGESVVSVASEQYSSALDAASRVIYGTPTGTVESLANAASDKYSQAVAA